MPVQRIHPRKRLAASIARERTNVQMERLMTLAVVLARKAFAALGPLAHIWPLLAMRAQVTFKIELARESASTTLDGADKCGFVLPSALACHFSSGRRHMLYLDIL